MATMEQQSNKPKRELVFPSEYPVLTPPREFLERCDRYGLVLEPTEIDALARFLSLMLACNEVLNLTSITEPLAAWEKHIFDSLTLLPFMQESGKSAKVADIGSGGGVPAIPLAIVCPGFDFTLIETTGKKAQFLMHAALTLGLGNVRTVNSRAEDVGQEFRTHRAVYDIVTARAVGRINVLAELTAPLVKVGGLVVLTKGEKAQEELDEARLAMKTVGLAHAGTHETPTGRVVVLEKTRPTPRPYPRRAGEPKRSPIGSSSSEKK